MRHLHLHHGHAHHGGHDARLHHSSRAMPWFLLAAVALLAAVVAGCGSDSGVDAGASSDGTGSPTEDSDDPSSEDLPGTTAPGTVAPATDIFDSDFLSACDGVGYDQATAYTPGPGAIHPVVVLAGQGTEMYGRSGAVREAWTRMWTPENTTAMAEIELVACAEKINATPVQECSGYEVDGQPTDNIVHLNEVEYAVSLREALTGAEVASTTIVARDAECPMYVSFVEGEYSQEWDSFDALAIQAFVEPYVAP
jgi:hypothetical protein